MKAVEKVKDAGVTLRAVLLALILIPIDNLWITIIEVRWYALDGTCLPIFITPVFILFLIAFPNQLFRKHFPNWALKRGEMLVIYMMVVMGACLASHDLIQNLFGIIGHPHFMANATNRYEELFFQYLPPYLFVDDATALKGFYKGGMNPWTWNILSHWIIPLACWGLLIMVLIGMMMCMNIIIRKQWTEHEKLVFPLIQLPIEMTSEDSGRKFYANKLMWAGFGIAALIGLVNGLHVLYPTLPYIQGIKRFDLGILITQRPWSAVAIGGNGFAIATYPFAIGLAYFIPLDLSFSCWFFYLLRKLVQVLGAAMGWDSGGSQFPYYEGQSSGAWMALGIIIIIGSYQFLKSVWQQAWRQSGTTEEMQEASLYRKAFWGLAFGFIFLILFSWYMGMTWWVAAVFFLIYFILAIAMTRVRAELGTPHEIYFVNPQHIMVSLFGYSILKPINLTMLASMYWFNRCYRSHPMPNILESFKMAEGTAIKLRPMIFALLLAALWGLISAYWANLKVTYDAGAHAKCLGYKWWVGYESFDQKLCGWLNNPPKLDSTNLISMAIGAGIVIGLKIIRSALISWPFHPAGYALAVSYAMDYFWFAFFVSWLIKRNIVHYGGMKLHNQLVPFFLGLILGDFFIGSIWAIIGPIINTQTYKIFI